MWVKVKPRFFAFSHIDIFIFGYSHQSHKGCTLLPRLIPFDKVNFSWRELACQMA